MTATAAIPDHLAERIAAARAYNDAYLVWHNALIDAFGAKDAPQAGYERRGRGEPGTDLRAAWEAKEAARKAWEASR